MISTRSSYNDRPKLATGNTMTMTMKTKMITRTARREKFSTATAVILLCAALLMTKSCGGDANVELPGQADAWSQISVSEGSGWLVFDQAEHTTAGEEVITEAIGEIDTTTIWEEVFTDNGLETTTQSEAETTTAIPSEPEQETTVKPNEDQPTSSPSVGQSTTIPSTEQVTTTPSAKQPSTSPIQEKPTTSIPSTEQPTTIPIEEQPNTSPSQGTPTTSSPSTKQPTINTSEDQSASSSSTSTSTTEEQPKTTEAEAALSTIAPTPPAPPVFECHTAGNFPDVSGDCQRFNKCLRYPGTGQLIPFEMICPELTVFSPTYGRCVRDLATCPSDAFVCPSPGRFASSSDTYYYNCLLNLQGGYHKYIVRCSAGQRFEPFLGRCWRYDWTQVYPGQALEASDLAAIKNEQKQFKADEKLRKKAEKNQEKQIRKQQQLEDKLAKKAAKEAAKKAAKEQANANKPFSLESAESPEL